MVYGKSKTNRDRDVSPWRPLSGSALLEQEMERLFEDFWSQPLGWPERRWLRDLKFGCPAIEVYEDKGSVVVKAEIPGLQKDDLEVKLSDDVLTIRGEKKEDRDKKEKGYYYNERLYGSFSRSIQLPTDVQHEKVTASFKDGILELHLPKTEEAKRKEVEIKVR